MLPTMRNGRSIDVSTSSSILHLVVTLEVTSASRVIKSWRSTTSESFASTARRVARRRKLRAATGALGEIIARRRAAIATTRKGTATTTLVRLESAVGDTSRSMATERFGDGALAEACTLTAPVFYMFVQSFFFAIRAEEDASLYRLSL